MASLFFFHSLHFLLVFTCMLYTTTVVTAGAHYRDGTFKFNLLSSTKQNHTWVGPIGHCVITVDVNGGGNFRSVQDAVNAVPDNNRMNTLIQISAGYYMYESTS